MPAFELSAANAAEYLRGRGQVFQSEPSCRELGGGVSNTVVLVEDGAERLVLKQALPQLRVRDEWLADRSRIFRERDGLLAAAKLLPRPWVPEIHWSDDENFLYAMEALGPGERSWKDDLLAGALDAGVARRVGTALGLTIRGSHGSSEMIAAFGDQTAFDQLRIDPYYRTIARRHPDIAQAVHDWIGEMDRRRLALTHGDWSPKNMLLDGDRLVFIDYECLHYGDPAFDSGFVLNHLLLKSFYRPDLAAKYLELAQTVWTWTLSCLPVAVLTDFEPATVRHLGLLLLARIDGKSPAEYLTDEATRDRVRRLAKAVIADRPESIGEVLRRALDSAN